MPPGFQYSDPEHNTQYRYFATTYVRTHTPLRPRPKELHPGQRRGGCCCQGTTEHKPHALSLRFGGVHSAGQHPFAVFKIWPKLSVFSITMWAMPKRVWPKGLCLANKACFHWMPDSGPAFPRIKAYNAAGEGLGCEHGYGSGCSYGADNQISGVCPAAQGYTLQAQQQLRHKKPLDLNTLVPLGKVGWWVLVLDAEGVQPPDPPPLHHFPIRPI